MGDVPHHLCHLSKLGRFDQPGVLNSDSGESRDNGQDGKIIFVEERISALIHDLHDTNRRTLPLLQWDGDHVVGDGACRFIHLPEMAPISLGVRDDLRLAGSEDRACNAFVPWDGCARGYRLVTDRMIKYQSLCCGIGEKYRAILGIDDIESDL